MAVKGYPRTRFDIEDRTTTLEIATTSVGAPQPLAMQAFTSDRGPEEWTPIYNLKEFIEKYGEISFIRHGQPQLTVAEILKAGGAVLGKRIVDDNATLANITIHAKIITGSANGNTGCKYVYFYADSVTTAKTYDEAIAPYIALENTKFSIINDHPSPPSPTAGPAIDNGNGGYTNYSDDAVDYPLFTITATGRGYSNLSFAIKPIYTNKKGSNYLLYTIEVYRDNKVIESINFSFNPNIIINNVSYSMNPKISLGSTQIKIRNYENTIESFASALATNVKTDKINNISMTKNDIVNSDFISGKDKTGKTALGNLITRAGKDTENQQQITTGTGNEASTASHNMWIELIPSELTASGTGANKRPKSNVIQATDSGIIEFSFTTADTELVNNTTVISAAGRYCDPATGGISYAPIAGAGTVSADITSAYETALLNAFGKRMDGTTLKNIEVDGNTALYPQFSTDIYDLDRYKVDFICDCGYPTNVKRAITDLVEYRGDMVFIADLGGEKLSNTSDIISKASDIFDSDHESKFVAIYHNVFDIYDPYSGKQITVTMPLLLASRLVTHIANGAGRPFAGILHDITFPEIIKNSVNYIPRITPDEDQKQKLIDANVNYLAIYNNLYVMDTMYVNQSNYTQLSYLSNIMGVQQIIKKIRDKCPATRYTFLDGNDLEKYIDDAMSVVNNYNSFFKSISINYMADESYESNNIFYAVLKVQFRNFVQEEYFKIIALS